MPTDRVVVSGGLVVARGETTVNRADIVLEGDSIAAIVPPPGTADAPPRRIDATRRLIIPGLGNAHTHGHGGPAKGAGDRWSLEPLLNADPWINDERTGDDRHLSTLLSAGDSCRARCGAGVGPAVHRVAGTECGRLADARCQPFPGGIRPPRA